MSKITEKDKKYIAGTYARFPVEIISGKGSEVYDVNGKRYIDMGSGIGVTSFGIADEIWEEAVKKQLSEVQHMSNLYYTAPCTELAELLCKKTGMKKVFFSNSGAEANECAIKAARKYASEKKGSEYYNIITLVNSFHGRTIATLSATGQEHYHQLYTPLLPGFIHVSAGNTDEFKEAISKNKIAAVMIECVQGEGGVIALDREYVKTLCDIAKSEDILVIVDEVQTGNGRTGKLYAYMNYGIVPDIVTTAKGLGGGLPLGATMFGAKVENIFGAGDHGSTFGGNPVCCAGALSILERLDDNFLNDVKKKSDYIFSVLGNADGIKDVSGMGLMIGFMPKNASASEIVRKCIDKGVLCLTAKNKVRLLPALNIPDNLLYEAIDKIVKVCAETS